MFLGLPDPDPLVQGTDPDLFVRGTNPDTLVRGTDPAPAMAPVRILLSSRKMVRKTLIPTVL
jgi:hypothetical protein